MNDTASAAPTLCVDCGKRDGENGQHDFHHPFRAVPPPPETSPAGTTCGKAWWPPTDRDDEIWNAIRAHRHCTKDEGHGDPCGPAPAPVLAKGTRET